MGRGLADRHPGQPQAAGLGSLAVDGKTLPGAAKAKGDKTPARRPQPHHRPTAVTDWFHRCFVDGYDWVMLPKVVGMSQ